jgi:uncharacterized protein (TIGR00255 family)
MTGYGDARHQDERLCAAVEVRSVNNRYLKVTTKCPDSFAALEHQIEKLVRESVARGTVTVSVRLERLEGAEPFRINTEILKSYWKQLRAAAEGSNSHPPPDLGSLLSLPGVVSEEGDGAPDDESAWPLVRGAMSAALEKLQAFRATEGSSMADDVRANCRLIAHELEKVAALAPDVVRDYRDRLRDRLRDLLQGTEARIDDADLIREVSIFAERCDVNEEITRLRSHLDQFELFIDEKTSQGRRLEFLSQEMFREVNTIGSKANNVAIAHSVVDMKAAIDKLREILQNVE